MKDFIGQNIPPYAILSHTWGSEEVTLQDFQRPEARNKAGFSKIMRCCEQAKKDGLGWAWVDTCCIDKSSSAELSEAINSMYRWYQNSYVCYVFLEDVPPLAQSFPEEEFKRARWFKRGWCLQELIAPLVIEFYASDWTEIGTKWSLHGPIEEATGIPSGVLLNKSRLDLLPIAQKMSWASERETTRREDEAYCLLGIFGISMPLLYGEGERAFLRLQEEMMKKTDDYSLFLWTYKPRNPYPETSLGVFASSPSLFSREGPYEFTKGKCDYRKITLDHLQHLQHLSMNKRQWNPPQMTNRGLRVQAFTFGLSAVESSLLMWTGCIFESDYICITLRQNDTRDSKYSRQNSHEILLVDETQFRSFGLSDLYLNADPHSPPPMQAPTWLGSRSRHLRVILSTRVKGDISFIEIIPGGKKNYTIRRWAQGLDFSCPNQIGVVSLGFRADNPQSTAIPGLFIVDYLERGMAIPWCTVRVPSAENSSFPNNGSIEAGFSDSKHANVYEFYRDGVMFTDRATALLSNGSVVYAAAKRNRARAKEVGGGYILHLTLLGGSP